MKLPAHASNMLAVKLPAHASSMLAVGVHLCYITRTLIMFNDSFHRGDRQKMIQFIGPRFCVSQARYINSIIHSFVRSFSCSSDSSLVRSFVLKFINSSVRPTVGTSARPSVSPSVCLSVRPSFLP